MGEEEVEFVRRTLEMFIGGDVEGAWARWSDDATAVPPPDWPESETVRGRDAIAELFAGWDDAFGADSARLIRPRSFRHLGAGRMLVEFDFESSGAGSGVPIDQPLAAIYTVRNGAIVHSEFFMSPEEGRRAAGFE